MTAIVNLDFRSGETWSMDVTCRDSLGNPINIVDADLRWRLSFQNKNDMELSLSNGITLVNGAGGACLIVVTPAMQAAAKVGSGFYQHQLRVTLPDGTVTDQFTGAFNVRGTLF